MRFSEDQVLAALEDKTYPLTTSEVVEQCYLNANQPLRQGRGSGYVADVRTALEALVANGTVVSAKHSTTQSERLAKLEAATPNPYQFIARSSRKETYWMEKTRANAFQLELGRRHVELTKARAAMTQLGQLVPGLKVEVRCAQYSGDITFEMSGSAAQLYAIVDALAIRT